MKTTIYENKDFILIRKPHGIPSTFGAMESFLDMIKNNTLNHQKSERREDILDDGGIPTTGETVNTNKVKGSQISKAVVCMTEQNFTWTPLSALVPADIFPFIISRLEDFTPVEDPEVQLRQQVDTFGEDQEFGLLNRLDNETGGFLYFAKHQKAFDHFKSLQKSELVKKFYLAQIEGMLKPTAVESGEVESFSRERLNPQQENPSTLHLNTPIMHHKSHPEKMVAIRDPKDVRLGRSKQHEVSTQVDILHYDKKINLTTILATIRRGIRHQIRVHLASSGHPIIGDALYGKKGDSLHLRSIGFSLD